MVVTGDDEIREIRDRLAASCAGPQTRRDFPTERTTDLVARRVLRALDAELAAYVSLDGTSRRIADPPDSDSPPAAPDITPQPRPWEGDAPWRTDLPPTHADDEGTDAGESEEPFYGW